MSIGFLVVELLVIIDFKESSKLVYANSNIDTVIAGDDSEDQFRKLKFAFINIMH